MLLVCRSRGFGTQNTVGTAIHYRFVQLNHVESNLQKDSYLT